MKTKFKTFFIWSFFCFNPYLRRKCVPWLWTFRRHISLRTEDNSSIGPMFNEAIGSSAGPHCLGRYGSSCWRRIWSSRDQGCGVGVGAGVGVSRSWLFCSESESESESTKFTDSDRLRASFYSRFKEIAMQIILNIFLSRFMWWSGWMIGTELRCSAYQTWQSVEIPDLDTWTSRSRCLKCGTWSWPSINFFAIAFDQLSKLFEHSPYQWQRHDTLGVQTILSID